MPKTIIAFQVLNAKTLKTLQMRKIHFGIGFTLQPVRPPSDNSKPNKGQSIQVDGKLFTTVFNKSCRIQGTLFPGIQYIARLRLDNYKRSHSKSWLSITDLDEEPCSIAANTRLPSVFIMGLWQWIMGQMDCQGRKPTHCRGWLFWYASRGVEIWHHQQEWNRKAEYHGKPQEIWIAQYRRCSPDALSTTSSKEERRQKVLADHEIVMLLEIT